MKFFNALDRLSEIPYKKVLVITDPFLAQSSMINLITDPLKKGHIEYDIYQEATRCWQLKVVMKFWKNCSPIEG